MEQGIRCENRVYGRGEGRLHLFYEITHSSSLIELVGVDEARRAIDFCARSRPTNQSRAC